MTTVGYGDFYPSTALGRFVGYFACIWGPVLFAFLGTVFLNQINLSRNEMKAYQAIKNHKQILQVERKASQVIIKYLLQKSLEQKKKSKKRTLALANIDPKMRVNLLEFKTLRRNLLNNNKALDGESKKSTVRTTSNRTISTQDNSTKEIAKLERKRSTALDMIDQIENVISEIEELKNESN